MNSNKGLFPWRMAIACALFSYLYSWSGQYASYSLLTSVFGLFALGYGIVAAWGFRSVLGFLPLWWQLKKPTGLYGTSFKPTIKDAVEFGLALDNSDGDGFPAAALDGKILYYRGNSHVTCVASNGAGKSASVSIPMGFSVGKHKSLIFTGKGAEMSDIVGPYRRDVLKQDVFINDVWGISGEPNYCINPTGDLHEFVEREDTEALDISDGRSLILIPEAKGDQKYFVDFARPILSDSIIFGVYNELDCGELSGNLPWVYQQFSGSEKHVKTFLQDMAGCEIYSGRIKRSGERLLGLLNQSPKTGLSVIGEITNALSLFDPATKLGQSIICSDFDVKRIKQKPTTIGICIPPDKINSHGLYAGLICDMLISTSLRARKLDVQCVFLLDEFGNLSKGEIPSIRTAQYLGRSLGTQLIMFAQDTSIFERYEEPSAFVTQSEVYMAWSVRDTKDAEELSKRSGNTSVMVENTNLNQDMSGDTNSQYSVGVTEKSVPLYRPDEFLQMQDYTAALFYKQNPPIMTDLVHYQSVKEWLAYANTNPAIQMDGVPVKYSLN